MQIETKLEKMGLFLPAAAALPHGQAAQFAWARTYKDMVYLFRGKVGSEVSFEEAQEASRLATLSHLSRCSPYVR